MDSLAEAVKEINPSCIVVGAKLDVGSGEATKALLQKILQERGQFDFLCVHNFRLLCHLLLYQIVLLAAWQQQDLLLVHF